MKFLLIIPLCFILGCTEEETNTGGGASELANGLDLNNGTFVPSASPTPAASPSPSPSPSPEP